jgi:hypothetical protein
MFIVVSRRTGIRFSSVSRFRWVELFSFVNEKLFLLLLVITDLLFISAYFKYGHTNNGTSQDERERQNNLECAFSRSLKG